METAARVGEHLRPFLARIRSEDGRAVYGAGFLISESEVLTCAHVVADALGLSRQTLEAPDGTVYLDFPLLDSAAPLAATVQVWRAPEGEQGMDMAVLVLQGRIPSNARPAPLSGSGNLRGHTFTVYGFPKGHNTGVYTYGIIRDRRAMDWQIEGQTETGYPILPGFSGGPVWDDALKAVVGMVFMAEQKQEVKAAFMLPIEALQERGVPLPLQDILAKDSELTQSTDNSDNSIRNQEGVQINDIDFATVCELKTARKHHMSVKLLDGDVFIAGGVKDDGESSCEVLASAELLSRSAFSVPVRKRMVNRRYYAAAALLPNNQVLLTGGKGEDEETLDSAELYNPQNPSFTKIGQMTSKRHGHAAITLRSGQVLIMGGSDGQQQTGQLSSAEIYDPISNSFRSTGSMSEGRLTEHSPNAVLLNDGSVLVAGGYGSEGQLASVEIYHPNTGIFVYCGNLAVKRACHSMTLLPNGKVLIAGGYEDNVGHLATAEIFDPETGSTSMIENMMKVSHCLHTATLIQKEKGAVLIAGGTSPVVEMYNLATHEFSVVGKLITSRTLHTAFLSSSGQLVLIGGQDNQGKTISTIEQSKIVFN